MGTMMLEQEIAVVPRLAPPAGRPVHTGPGFAEIKPHSYTGILAGLVQLREEHARRVATLPKGGAVPPGYLITYRYPAKPLTVGGPATMAIYVLVPKPAMLTAPPPRRGPGTAGKRTWIDGLGQWYQLSPNEPVPTHPMTGWLKVAGRTALGSMVEPIVRRRFILWLRGAKDTTRFKQPHVKGSDVTWREVAEYLYEVASELGSTAEAPRPAAAVR